MNIPMFVSLLSEDEFKELYSAVIDRNRRDSIERMKHVYLSPKEYYTLFVKKKTVDTIKMLRDRTGYSLLECKAVIDREQDMQRARERGF